MSCSIFRLAPKSRAASLRDGSDAARPHTLCGRTKSETYAAIGAALEKFIAKYPVDLTGRMATLNSFLYANFPRMNFVGFYTVKTPGAELQVGPYQGEVLACGTIAFGKGVCGTVAASGATAVIPDVRAVENYIACAFGWEAGRARFFTARRPPKDARHPLASQRHPRTQPAGDEETLSEIVVPVFGGAYHNEPPAAPDAPKKLIAVLDIDGDAVGAFDEEDARELAALCARFL